MPRAARTARAARAHKRGRGESDFKRRKFKVGRKAPRAANATNVSFQVHRSNSSSTTTTPQAVDNKVTHTTNVTHTVQDDSHASAGCHYGGA